MRSYTHNNIQLLWRLCSLADMGPQFWLKSNQQPLQCQLPVQQSHDHKLCQGPCSKQYGASRRDTIIVTVGRLHNLHL